MLMRLVRGTMQIRKREYLKVALLFYTLLENGGLSNFCEQQRNGPALGRNVKSYGSGVARTTKPHRSIKMRLV